MPDLLHIVPVGHDSVLNRVLQSQDSSLGLSLVTNICVLLVHTDHDTSVFWSSNDGREDCGKDEKKDTAARGEKTVFVSCKIKIGEKIQERLR